METITSRFTVFCDTYDTEVKAVMHEAKSKLPGGDSHRKLQLTITGNDKTKHQVSLWKEDVILLANFLQAMSENLDSRLDIKNKVEGL